MIELYKDLIIDHGLNPRNNHVLNKYTHTRKAYNHFCGDSFDLYLFISVDIIKDISFSGHGCSISTASASLMTLAIKNKNINYTKNIFLYFINLIKKDIQPNKNFDDINVLSNVNKFPSRVKCATLIWHALNDILVTHETL